MSARDSSALAYVGAMRHGKKRVTDCRCERCVSITRVLKLATDHVSFKRVAPRFARVMNSMQPNSRGILRG